MQNDHNSRRGALALLPAGLLAAFVAMVAIASAVIPARTGEMAVVFPPFTDEVTAWALVREAGGQIVGPTQISNIVVAYAPDDQFQHRIQKLGALFFVAASGLCASIVTPDR